MEGTQHNWQPFPKRHRDRLVADCCDSSNGAHNDSTGNLSCILQRKRRSYTIVCVLAAVSWLIVLSMFVYKSLHNVIYIIRIQTPHLWMYSPWTRWKKRGRTQDTRDGDGRERTGDNRESTSQRQRKRQRQRQRQRQKEYRPGQAPGGECPPQRAKGKRQKEEKQRQRQREESLRKGEGIARACGAREFRERAFIISELKDYLCRQSPSSGRTNIDASEMGPYRGSGRFHKCKEVIWQCCSWCRQSVS